MRYLSIIGAVFLAVVLTGCEEGEEIDIDPGVSREISLEVLTTEPITAGTAVRVQATVTEETEPVLNVDVIFSATADGVNLEAIIPNPVKTSLGGISVTTVSTQPAHRELRILATSGNSTSNLISLTLLAPPR